MLNVLNFKENYYKINIILYTNFRNAFNRQVLKRMQNQKQLNHMKIKTSQLYKYKKPKYKIVTFEK